MTSWVFLHLMKTLLHANWAILIMLLQDNKQIHEASTRTNWTWSAIDSSFLAEQLMNWIKTKMCDISGFLVSWALICALKSFSGHSRSWTKELKCSVHIGMAFSTDTRGKRVQGYWQGTEGEKEINIHLMPTNALGALYLLFYDTICSNFYYTLSTRWAGQNTGISHLAFALVKWVPFCQI